MSLNFFRWGFLCSLLQVFPPRSFDFVRSFEGAQPPYGNKSIIWFWVLSRFVLCAGAKRFPHYTVVFPSFSYRLSPAIIRDLCQLHFFLETIIVSNVFRSVFFFASICLAIVILSTQICRIYNIRQRPYRNEYTGSLPNSEVNRCRARLVLDWGTVWEYPWVLLAF